MCNLVYFIQSTHIARRKSVAEVDVAGNGNRSVRVNVATVRPVGPLAASWKVFLVQTLVAEIYWGVFDLCKG